MQEKDFNKIEVKSNICINVLDYENGLVFPIYISDQKLEDSMDLLLLSKHFNKNLIMTEEEQHLFQESKSCWICKKLIDNDEKKVRDHCHINGKFRGPAHWDCIIFN